MKHALATGRGVPTTTDSSGNPAANVQLNSGLAQDVTPEHNADGVATTNIVAAAPSVITGLTAMGFPYETVTFTRTGLTGNVGLTAAASTSGSFIFALTWSAGADAVNITAEDKNGNSLGNIPYDVAGTVAVVAITADATGTLYLGK